MSCTKICYIWIMRFFSFCLSASTTISTPTTTPAGKNSVYPLLRPSGVGGGGLRGVIFVASRFVGVSIEMGLI